MQKIWCDWTYSGKQMRKEAFKAISRENAQRMIDTSEMIRQDRYDAYQNGRMTVYMEDVVRRLEGLQRGESEEEEKSRWLTRRKQQIWEEQYQQHHSNLKELKGHYEAGFIIEEILGPRPETPLLDDIATQEQLNKLKEDRKKTDEILEEWHTPCLLYTSPSPRDRQKSRMPSSA